MGSVNLPGRQASRQLYSFSVPCPPKIVLKFQHCSAFLWPTSPTQLFKAIQVFILQIRETGGGGAREPTPVCLD
jgi:hypothetical protein